MPDVNYHGDRGAPLRDEDLVVAQLKFGTRLPWLVPVLEELQELRNAASTSVEDMAALIDDHSEPRPVAMAIKERIAADREGSEDLDAALDPYLKLLTELGVPRDKFPDTAQ